MRMETIILVTQVKTCGYNLNNFLIKYMIIFKNIISKRFSCLFSILFLYNSAYCQIPVPKKIVSLAPAITEQLFLLGAGDDIVGVTTYCEFPEEAKQKEKVGTYLEPNLEKLLRLKPDLVLFAKEGHNKETVDRMEALGLKVAVLAQCNNYEEIFTQFIEIGKLTSRENKAKEIITKLRKRIKTVSNKTKNLKKPKVFFQLGSNPLMTAAKNTFNNEMISLAGGENIARNSNIRYPRYNPEAVIRQNPDVIIFVNMGDTTEAEIEKWKKYPELEAVKNNRIFMADTHKTCSPTPVNFVEALEAFCTFIHPELK